MANVLILGGSGMIGTGLAQSLQAAGIAVEVTSRSGESIDRIPEVAVHKFEALTDSLADVLSELNSGDYVINCIGMVKSLINDEGRQSRDRAIS
jgi:dTDP-4-dehydrorhamnose reductase